MRRCRWRLTLIATAVATWIGMAQAHQMIYDQDGYKLAVGIEGGLGGFAVGNVDTGAGNVNTDAPLDGPFPPSERRNVRSHALRFDLHLSRPRDRNPDGLVRRLRRVGIRRRQVPDRHTIVVNQRRSRRGGA